MYGSLGTHQEHIRNTLGKNQEHIRISVCVYYRSAYYKAVRVGGGDQGLGFRV